MFFKNNKYLLGENDEGPHHKEGYTTREWWYYNGFFNHPDSELKGWSFAVSYNALLNYSSIKFLIHGDKKVYGGPCARDLDAIVTKGPGVNVRFLDSYVKGKYPKWSVYVENTDTNGEKIAANLVYTAKSKPIWIFRNTGHNLSDSFFGYYCVMKTDVEGTVTVGGNSFFVKGIGYHDHTWSNFLKNELRKKTNFSINQYIWDWLCIHLENGWDLFVAKMHLNNRRIISKYMIGCICFSPDGKNSFQNLFFPLNYKEFKEANVSDMRIPTKIHIKTIKFNLLKPSITDGPVVLDITYEANTLKEMVYGTPPFWGQWDSTGKVNCVIKNLKGKKVVKGWAMMEYTNFF